GDAAVRRGDDEQAGGGAGRAPTHPVVGPPQAGHGPDAAGRLDGAVRAGAGRVARPGAAGRRLAAGGAHGDRRDRRTITDRRRGSSGATRGPAPASGGPERMRGPTPRPGSEPRAPGAGGTLAAKGWT